SDGAIFTNATTDGKSSIVVLSSAGELVVADPLSAGSLEELAFDPLDISQSTVLAGSDSALAAVDAFTGAESTRVTVSGANYTSVALNSTGTIFLANSATGHIFSYAPDGSQGKLFAATPATQIDALAIDSHDNVYAAQGASNQIAKFDKTGGFAGYLKNP